MEEKTQTIICIKSAIASLVFTAALVVWESVFLRVPIVEFLITGADKWSVSYTLYLLFHSFVSILLFALFVYTALVSGRIVKIVCAILFSLSVFYEYGYANIFERFSTPIELQFALFYISLDTKLDASVRYFSAYSLVSCLVFVFTLIFFKCSEKYWKKWLFVITVAVTVAFYGFSHYVLSPIYVTEYPKISLENTTDAFVRIAPIWALFVSPEREMPEAYARDNTTKKRNIILVTDESVLPDHLSLYNYSRETTPYLKELEGQGKIIKMEPAVSGSTCSQPSGYLLLTGLSISDLPDQRMAKLRSYPSIFQYAHAAGYKTHFLDGHAESFWNSPYLTAKYVDLKDIDNWKPVSNFDRPDKKQHAIDFEIARETARIMSSSEGNFIWIWKRGVHIPYENKSPYGDSEWKSGDGSESLKRDAKDVLIDQYDQAIKYNLDEFFRILTPALEKTGSVLLYTSDHGQSFEQTAGKPSHCGTDPQMAKVPLFVMGDVGNTVPSDFKAVHANVFPTLLDLLKVPASSRKHRYQDSLLNPDAESPNERYFWGSNLEDGERIRFD